MSKEPLSDEVLNGGDKDPRCAIAPSTGSCRQPSDGAGILSGGCCSSTGTTTMGRRARRARFAAGTGYLALAGAMTARRLPGRISLGPAAIVPTWFGVAHLVAGVTGYPGCPELGAIPSVMLGREVGTDCSSWQRIDQWIEPGAVPESPCCAA
jgi:hypothetical protein